MTFETRSSQIIPLLRSTLELKSLSNTKVLGFGNSIIPYLKIMYTYKLRENIILFKNKYCDIDDVGLKWDLIKMEIRGFTVKYSKVKAKKWKKECSLQNITNELLKKSETNPNNKELLNELYATKLRLQTVMRQKTKGAIIRSKTRWQEQG